MTLAQVRGARTRQRGIASSVPCSMCHGPCSVQFGLTVGASVVWLQVPLCSARCLDVWLGRPSSSNLIIQQEG